MQAILEQNQEQFYKLELAEREAMGLPPFTRLASLIITGPDAVHAMEYCVELGRCAPHHPLVEILGPTQAPIPLVRDQYRFRFLIKYPKTLVIQAIIDHWIKQVKAPPKVMCRVDIDPLTFF